MADKARRLDLLVRGRNVAAGDVVRVSPGAILKHIDFRVVRLRTGENVRGRSPANETVIVMLAGTLDISAGGRTWPRVGKRTDPFSGLPSAFYLPRETAYEMTAVLDAEIAVCEAPGPGSHPLRSIELEEDAAYVRGAGHAERRICNILMDEDAASSLFLTEVITPPGNWSSYPPHKHDANDPPRESQLEELYYYRTRPAQGFAFQRVYTASGDLDETVTAHDTDVVLVPRGYHVVAAAAQYTVYYLNVLAGPKHVYAMSFDPAHAWIKEGWTW